MKAALTWRIFNNPNGNSEGIALRCRRVSRYTVHSMRLIQQKPETVNEAMTRGEFQADTADPPL